uniref:Ribosomal protein L11 methyltransferase n=2 Tax=unclassified Prevotella TaxID=2638335 RepID=A0AB33JHT6_9BACT
MKYIIVKFNIPTGELRQTASELLADSMGEIGFEAFEDTEDGINGYIQEDMFHDEIVSQQIAQLPFEGIHITYTAEKAEDKNWNQEWEEQGFDPICVDGKITIYDAKHTAETPQLTDREIGIEPVQAFGSGTHQTTQMIVSQLLALDLSQKRVLDCGCGTGILGIVAAKLGAHEVIGYDIDEWSIENSEHNARLNNVENLTVLLGNSSVLSHVCGVFDVVMANINRNILLDDMHNFKDVMGSNAKLILSGFYTEDAESLIQKATDNGLELLSTTAKDNWCCLLFGN